ncbi:MULTISPECIES: DsbA family protein [Kitasatospora]|uniref:Protein-disulfide isomerase n=2 Tax=Kitasatospora TaxID=2063 RepID=A0ABT1J5C9_9ACTN|nr:thioredoxin domain-containing protein [Kitasatospora paracochleata]MCP2312639.1 protein-disulfide isomerase [Kitasatospora paracochleata]
MSEKNREGKRTARERMMAERAAQEAKDKRTKKLVVGGVVVAVVAAAAVTGVVVQNQRSKPETPVAAPTGAIGDKSLVIPSGAADAPSTLTVYEDPRCPACGMYERTFSPTIDQLEDQGKLQVNYHVVSFIDRSLGGTGSKHGANALACAQDAGHFRDYHDVLYRNQPDETSDAFGDKQVLLDLAKQVPGLSTPVFEACVNDSKYGGWVSAVQQDFDKSSYKSTPTVLLNGTPIYPKKGDEQISPENLAKWVDEANAGKQPGSTGSHGQSPAPTSTASEPNTPPTAP